MEIALDSLIRPVLAAFAANAGNGTRNACAYPKWIFFVEFFAQTSSENPEQFVEAARADYTTPRCIVSREIFYLLTQMLIFGYNLRKSRPTAANRARNLEMEANLWGIWAIGAIFGLEVGPKQLVNQVRKFCS